MSHQVLIIDDSSTMRKIVTRSLRQAGLQFDNVLEAGDGLEALNVLATETVDLILSDINMPNMDGLEFLRKKAEDNMLQKIPVVMITTEGSSEILEKAMHLGASGSIKKPFTPDQIIDKVGKLI